jgi:hypothetical protein
MAQSSPDPRLIVSRTTSWQPIVFDAAEENGFRILVRLSNATLGTTSVQYSSLNIQGISRN